MIILSDGHTEWGDEERSFLLLSPHSRIYIRDSTLDSCYLIYPQVVIPGGIPTFFVQPGRVSAVPVMV